MPKVIHKIHQKKKVGKPQRTESFARHLIKFAPGWMMLMKWLPNWAWLESEEVKLRNRSKGNEPRRGKTGPVGWLDGRDSRKLKPEMKAKQKARGSPEQARDADYLRWFFRRSGWCCTVEPLPRRGGNGINIISGNSPGLLSQASQTTQLPSTSELHV